MNPYVTIYGPYPLTWRDVAGYYLRRAHKAVSARLKGRNTL